jgi:hypothetical protein
VLFNCLADNAFFCLVVSFHGVMGWMAHFFKGGANSTAFLGRDEGSTNFSFGGRCHDIFHDGADDVNRTIEQWIILGRDLVRVRTEVEKTTCPRLCFRFSQIGGIKVIP